MSMLFNEAHRALQEEFGTRRMADKIEQIACHGVVGPNEKGFIESRDMVFFATVDAAGCPTVSYKGGDPGFIRVVDERTVIFPSYDSNGMYLSMGNIASRAEVGLLFMDFEKPNWLRLQGQAELSRDPALLGLYKEAELVVKVAVRAVFVNCPRYVHRYEKVAPSRYVPRDEAETPVCTWKRVDEMQEMLPDRDAAKVAALGGKLLTSDEWIGMVVTGHPEA
jgi:predicted pyridoxine 5'-phosphate oxidase superfamily flavin-nucleotide-binding protein